MSNIAGSMFGRTVARVAPPALDMDDRSTAMLQEMKGSDSLQRVRANVPVITCPGQSPMFQRRMSAYKVEGNNIQSQVVPVSPMSFNGQTPKFQRQISPWSIDGNPFQPQVSPQSPMSPITMSLNGGTPKFQRQQISDTNPFLMQQVMKISEYNNGGEQVVSQDKENFRMIATLTEPLSPGFEFQRQIAPWPEDCNPYLERQISPVSPFSPGPPLQRQVAQWSVDGDPFKLNSGTQGGRQGGRRQSMSQFMVSQKVEQ